MQEITETGLSWWITLQSQVRYCNFHSISCPGFPPYRFFLFFGDMQGQYVYDMLPS